MGSNPTTATPVPSGEIETFSFPQKNGIWPILKNRLAARWAVKQGAYSAFFVAGVTTAVIVWAKFINPKTFERYTLTWYTYVSCVVFAAIGYLIWKHNSRGAAVTGLALFVISKVYYWRSISSGTILLIVAITLGFLHGARGCYAWHNYDVMAGEAERPEGNYSA